MKFSKSQLYRIPSKDIHCLWAAIYPVWYAKYFYKKTTGQNLNIKNPKTLDEKSFWLRIHSDLSQWTELADKYKVRDYIKQCGLGHTLVKLYGVWDKAEDIDFDKLPDKFVLKTNHGFSRVILVPEKKRIDIVNVREQLAKWVNDKYGLVSFEPHYWNIQRKIIAEEYLQDMGSRRLSSSLIDYKFLCLNGEPEMIFVIYDRKKRTERVDDEPGLKTFAVDINWNLINDVIPECAEKVHSLKIPKPECIREMTEIARILAKPFPMVRVDLYEVNRKVYFGELTFTPGGGRKISYKYLLKWGEKMDLSLANPRIGRSIV
jgi:hypothetical protein